MRQPEFTRAFAAAALPLAFAAVLLVLGLAGVLGAATGYGLLVISGLLLVLGTGVFALFALTSRFDDKTLLGSARRLVVAGAWGYGFAVAVLAGHYVREALSGRVEFRWIVFGPAVLAALAVLDVGLYRILVRRQLPTLQRYRHVVVRSNIEPESLRRVLVDEVVLHRTLFSTSRLRWLRHTLIYWGFMLLFGIELLAVVFREVLPAFGFADIYADPFHPLRLGFQFAFNVTGLMVLAGCGLALYWRIRVNGTDLQKFSDTPTSLFLLFVVVSGFVAEASHIAALGRDPRLAAAFLGYAVSFLLPRGGYQALWLLHVLAACAFIAYVPLWRLVHSCATPLGRLMNSQKLMLAKKKMASLQGLMGVRLGAERNSAEPPKNMPLEAGRRPVA